MISEVAVKTLHIIQISPTVTVFEQETTQKIPSIS